MPGSFHTEVDRYWAGWSRRVTWRKMEERKKPPLAEAKKWRQLSIVPWSYLAAVSVLTSGHNLLPRFLWELGKWRRKGKWTRGTSEDKSKASTGGDQEKGEESTGEEPMAQRWTWDGRDGTLPCRRQRDTFLLVVRREQATGWSWGERRVEDSRASPDRAGKLASTESTTNRKDNSKTQAKKTAGNSIIIMKCYECIIGQSKNNEWEIIKNALMGTVEQVIKINSFSYIKNKQLKIYKKR